MIKLDAPSRQCTTHYLPPMATPLHTAISGVLAIRAKKGTLFPDIFNGVPSSEPDLFSNDYRSLDAASEPRKNFLDKLADTPENVLFGCTGSRLGTGNT